MQLEWACVVLVDNLCKKTLCLSSYFGPQVNTNWPSCFSRRPPLSFSASVRLFCLKNGFPGTVPSAIFRVPCTARTAPPTPEPTVVHDIEQDTPSVFDTPTVSHTPLTSSKPPQPSAQPSRAPPRRIATASTEQKRRLARQKARQLASIHYESFSSGSPFFVPKYQVDHPDTEWQGRPSSSLGLGERRHMGKERARSVSRNSLVMPCVRRRRNMITSSMMSHWWGKRQAAEGVLSSER